jgi:hypothetical protein
MSTLYAQLRADILAAAKARQMEKLTSLRTIDGAIQRVAIDENREIDDELVLATLRKAVKDLKGASEQFAQGGRQDLVAKNAAEVELLEVYLPQAIEGEKLEVIVDEAIAASGATTKRDMGKVMGQLKKRPDADQIDFGAASMLIQSKLD